MFFLNKAGSNCLFERDLLLSANEEIIASLSKRTFLFLAFSSSAFLFSLLGFPETQLVHSKEFSFVLSLFKQQLSNRCDKININSYYNEND